MKNLGIVLALLLSPSCSDTDSTAVPMPGGDTTSDDRTSSAYENPAPNLNEEELEQHLAGDVVFEAVFVSAPAEINPGLGPLFNNTSCLGCHIRDGRGLPVVGHEAQGSLLLVRVSAPEGQPDVPGGPIPAPGFGLQLQDHAIFGQTPEINVEIEWVEQAGEFPADGTPFSLRRPVFYVTLANDDPFPADLMLSGRIPPPMIGLGLLEAVPEADLMAMADPDDLDNDEISGRINMVWSVENNKAMPGRFGWKANTPTLLQQAASAYRDDMGVTNPMFPEDNGESDIDEEILEDAAFYTQTLGVPGRGEHSAQVRKGEELFLEAGCESCHVSELITGTHEIAALTNQVIHPYTDLLIHNMGFDLADGRPDFQASATEWRTSPLWGIGVAKRVLFNARFLHDGRARNLTEAILWHGGESEASKEAFRLMSAADREAMLAFLGSL